jgi:hypothetical protein
MKEPPALPTTVPMAQGAKVFRQPGIQRLMANLSGDPSDHLPCGENGTKSRFHDARERLGHLVRREIRFEGYAAVLGSALRVT